MRCKKCGLELIVYRVKKTKSGKREVTYACRNKNCGAFEKKLAEKRSEEPKKEGEETAS